MRGVGGDGRNTSRGLASAAVICGLAGILTVGVGAAIGVIAGVMSIARAREDSTGRLFPWLATAFTIAVALAWPLLIAAHLWDQHTHPGAGGEIPAPTTMELLAIPFIQLIATLLTLLVIKLIQRERSRQGERPTRRLPERTTP
jgi:hypothetical protein